MGAFWEKWSRWLGKSIYYCNLSHWWLDLRFKVLCDVEVPTLDESMIKTFVIASVHRIFYPTSYSSTLSSSLHILRFDRRTFSAMAGAGGEDFVKGNVYPNGVAVITLDRTKALNAMNLGNICLVRWWLPFWNYVRELKLALGRGIWFRY